jgi:hypothetical protein
VDERSEGCARRELSLSPLFEDAGQVLSSSRRRVGLARYGEYVDQTVYEVSGQRSSSVTTRKPPGSSWESWIDRQIREAAERGEFENLPGTGKPIANLDKPHDENWWIRQKLRSEDLSYLPPSLALKKEAHSAIDTALCAKTQIEVREIIEQINAKIVRANRLGIDGPPVSLVPYDVQRVLRDWQERHTQEP